MKECTACARKTDSAGQACPICGGALASSATTSISATKLIGTTIDGQFVVDAMLGGGAFGTVYRGRQIGLDRAVAIKVPTFEIAADPIMARRFAREARAAARVHHPGVVAIYAVGLIPDGRPYLAMQFVEGEPLDKILIDGPLDATRALRIARHIASALSDTHVAEVVHRDLKPSNIMWRRDRSGDDRLTLVDFGIAVCKPGNAEASQLTAEGLIGTPHYMSPEQAHGEQVDARADIYALGCVLFELLTGSPPFAGSGFEVLLAHLGRPAPAPSERKADVPEVVDRLCAALLEKSPDRRPANADAVVAMIDEALETVASNSPPSASRPRTERVKRVTLATRRDLPSGAEPGHRRRMRRWVLGGAAATIAIVAGLAALTFGRSARGGEPEDTPNGPIDPRGANRREIFKDDGEIVLHALVPDPIVAGGEIRVHLEIKNKLGQPVLADELVVTVSDDHATKGLTARPHGGRDEPGHYDFHYTFPRAGRYLFRVFPPSIDSAFEIALDVR